MIEVRLIFSGVVLTVLHPETQEAAVFMPDCREATRDDRKSTLELEDGTIGQPHVGYLSFNLANQKDIGPRFPAGDDDGSRYEVVHRLDREELVLDVDPNEWDPASAERRSTGAPSATLNELAPALQPKQHL